MRRTPPRACKSSATAPRATGVACHALPGQIGSSGGITSTLGPTLTGIANRYNPLQLRQWVTDARQIKPDTLMPPFGST
ncbi:MAG: hypothetical protein IPJ18_19765, partial [Betaproteobacteria bacterium]|nr:hypothetical protein [Betaproteobacteria bacterium]